MSQSIDLIIVAKAICQQNNFSIVGNKSVGKGNFKETFHVRDLAQQEFALKVYVPEKRSERESREIDAIQKCKHQNIAELVSIDQFRFQGQEYLFTLEEYVGGGTLTSKLNLGTLSKLEVISLGTQLIDGVAHIASNNLVHRDLKPDNIMFRSDGLTPVIVDFGIVRDLQRTSLTDTWAIMGPGTPYFAAPEQLNNEKEQQDWRTDQFSLGVVLAMCVFGKHPYDTNGGDHITVNNVANRRGPSDEFREQVKIQGLVALEKMVAPWSLRRYRTPVDLATNWAKQLEG